MRKVNSSGFSLVAGLLIVLIVAVLGFAGYYVYNEQTKKNDNKTKTEQSNQNTSTNNSTSATTNPTSSTKYLEIKELGVKIKLTDKLKNAYYTYKDNGAYLSVHELDNMKGFDLCVAGLGIGQDGIAAIDYAKVGDDHFGSPWTEESIKNFSQATIGETHYWIEPRSQAPCYDTDVVSENDINDLGSFKQALVDQGSTITKLDTSN